MAEDGTHGLSLPSGKYQGLAGIRGLAAIAVFLFHLGYFGIGWISIQLFFVMSGFLITQLLVASKGAPFGSYLRVFFGRRLLRIAPSFYLYIVIVYAIHFFLRASGQEPEIFREGVSQLPYAAAYVHNLRWAWNPALPHNHLVTHFWSLAVEEQFYLAWPFFIYFLPERWFVRSLLAIVCLGPLIRAATYYAFLDPAATHAGREAAEAVYILPWCHIDAFAMGALVPFVKLKNERKNALRLMGIMLPVGLAMSYWTFRTWKRLGNIGYPHLLEPNYKFIWGYTLFNVFFLLVARSLIKREFYPRFFEHRVLVYLGDTAYTFYIVHMAMQQLVLRVLLKGWNPVITTITSFSLTVGIAAASYKFVELPILHQKDRLFPRSSATK